MTICPKRGEMGDLVQLRTRWSDLVVVQARRAVWALQAVERRPRSLRGSRRVAGAAGTAALAVALIGSGAASASYTYVASTTTSIACDTSTALGGATPPTGIGVPIGLGGTSSAPANCQQDGGVGVPELTSTDPLTVPDDDDVDDREDEEDRGRSSQSSSGESEK